MLLRWQSLPREDWRKLPRQLTRNGYFLFKFINEIYYLFLFVVCKRLYIKKPLLIDGNRPEDYPK